MFYDCHAVNSRLYNTEVYESVGRLNGSFMVFLVRELAAGKSLLYFLANFKFLCSLKIPRLLDECLFQYSILRKKSNTASLIDCFALKCVKISSI